MGAPALAALAAAIDRAKAADPFGPVTVVVPSPWAGLCLRRRLGSTKGLLNVRFVVMAELLARLGEQSLIEAGRRPLSRAVRAEAVRALLLEQPGGLGSSASHPATVAAVDRVIDELALLDERAMAEVAAAGPVAVQLVALSHALAERLAGWYGRHELVQAAAGGAASGRLGDAGGVVFHLTAEPTVGDLFALLAAATSVTALLPLTGDEVADAPIRRLADELATAGGASVHAPGVAPGVPLGTIVVRAPDPEEEVREAVRWAMAELEAGRPLYRLALLWATAEPYGAIAHRVLAAAGIPHHGPALAPLAASIAGRTLLGALAVLHGGLARSDVAAWLSGGPVLVQADGPLVPASDWDHLARAAGVIGGPRHAHGSLAALGHAHGSLAAHAQGSLAALAHWEARLGEHRIELERRRAEAERSDDAEPNNKALDRLDELRRFVVELADRLAPPAPSSWSAWGGWAQGLLQRYLGSRPRGQGWTETELEALADVDRRLADLAALDEAGTAPDLAGFRSAVEHTLASGGERLGAFGAGLFVGHLDDAEGMVFDGITLLGSVEGGLPRRPSADALLGDATRMATEGLATPADRAAAARRRYLTVLASAEGERRLSFPIADPRSQRRRLPSRWLLESASALEGRALAAAELCTLDGRRWLRASPSSFGAVCDAEVPVDRAEHRLGQLARSARAGRTLADHPFVVADARLATGIACITARAGPALSAWEGRVGAGGVVREEGVSATALERLAACPFRFFLERVLRVKERDEPEEGETIDGRERGTLVHSALQRLVEEIGSKPEHPDQPWSEAARARLDRIIDELCDDLERRGRTGAPLLWALERRRLHRELQRVLDDDDVMRRELSVVPKAAELGFGPGHEFPMEVELPSGRTLYGKGRIDRVDLSPDERRAAVFDYKTGKADGKAIEAPDDPTVRGTRLQPAFYALAAESAYPTVTEPVRSSYWYVSERGGFARHGFELDPERRAGVLDVLDVLDGLVADGLFPARPGKETGRRGRPLTYENCIFCPYDTLCPDDRDDAWRRARADPSVARYVALAEPDEEASA